MTSLRQRRTRVESSDSAGQVSVGSAFEGPAITFVLNSLGRGGSERKTVQLANGLVERGWRVTVAYLNGPDSLRAAFHESVGIAPLERAGRISPGAARRLARLTGEQSADAVVAINLYPMLYVAALRLMRRRPRPRLLASINTYTFATRTEALKMMMLVRPLFRFFDMLVFGAEEQRRLWRDRYGLVGRSTHTAVLYNGVDTARFQVWHDKALAIEGWPRTRLIVGIVGALRPEKGHGILLDALLGLKQRGLDVGLLIVGDGPEREAIAGGICARGLVDHVRLAGDVDDVRPCLAAMDVFALPSVETFSNAALEAMAMGCPVVATSIGGMPEMLRHGGGVLVEPGDVSALVDALAEVLTSEPLRRRIAAEARQAAETRFAVKVMVDQFELLLRQVKDSQAPPG